MKFTGLWKLLGIGLLLASITLLAIGVYFNVSSDLRNKRGVSRKPRDPPVFCGYESCPKIDPLKLNVHVVPHTHNDLGWLKTVDQYYYGTHTLIQRAGVQYIIDSVLDALQHDSARRFVYVETAFLWKWWKEQNKEKRETMRSLINEGRLEIIGGGWSMNDEAVTHYQSLIDQFTWGFRRLNDTFGSCARPKIGWQADTFGHSREQAALFAQLGFDGYFFGRIDFEERSHIIGNKSAEFVWLGNPSLGDSANIFSSLMPYYYLAPEGFCFDLVCDDDPIVDDPESPDYDLVNRGEEFIGVVSSYAYEYRTNNVLLTMGKDFTYQNAEMYFKNMDKLMRYIREKNDPGVNVFYSTPSCYIKALNEKNLTWPERTKDMLPFYNDPNGYWNGYYTSRPALKFFERMGNNFLQVVKQLSVLANENDNRELQKFREIMGVLQHHDAITGTEKQHVADDYARTLYRSMKNGEMIASKALSKLAAKKENVKKLEFHSCFLLNISSCTYTSDNKNFIVTVYNPTSQPLTTYVRVPVQGSAYNVKNFNNQEIITQIVPISKQLLKVPGRVSKATKELIIQADKINPLGYQSFYVSENTGSSSPVNNLNPSTDHSIEIDLYKVELNVDGKVEIQSLNENTQLNIQQSFHYYVGAEGNNDEFITRSSGAYIFRPKENFYSNFSSSLKYEVYKGPLVQEIHLVVNDWVSQVIRLYNKKNYIEFDWLIGPIFVEDKIGKEVITKYSSTLKTNGEFYTDSNGRQMIKRKRQEYDSIWSFAEPIASNYYPVTTKISIEDRMSNLRLSTLTDRAQGGSSLKDGEIELLLHRRLLSDDDFGVGEALNETAFGKGLVVRGQHYLITDSLTNINELTLREKELATELALRPWILVTPVNSLEEWTQSYNMKNNGILKTLPRNVRILTLEPWKDGEILVRLEHLFEKNESFKYSVPAEVNLKDLFAGFKVQSVRETNLGANQWIEDVNRLEWRSENSKILKNDGNYQTLRSTANSIIIKLNPMQIRTFILKISPS